MRMFKNWDVTGGVSDFWDYVRQPRPHRWTGRGAAIALAFFVFWGFSKYLFPYENPRPQTISFENWTATRNDPQVRADWLDPAQQTTPETAAPRAQLQKRRAMMGVAYGSSDADN